ncbi:MAG TPA: hypothetical protein ENI38_03075, partial [Candidatus Acetothermia bacterium]|nr:hypothetical protein [Candidatus Acetothermia bacterium]
TLSGGLGLVAWAAALGIEAGLSLPQVAELARAAAREVKFFGGLPNLEPLGRSGRVPWVAGWLSGRLRLGMVISVGGGHIRPVAPGWGARQLLGKVAALARETISRMGKPLVLIPHAAAAGVAEALAGRVAEAAPGPDAEIYIVDASPALGVHAGLGAFGVALLDRDRIEQEIRRLEGET